MWTESEVPKLVGTRGGAQITLAPLPKSLPTPWSKEELSQIPMKTWISTYFLGPFTSSGSKVSLKILSSFSFPPAPRS